MQDPTNLSEEEILSLLMDGEGRDLSMASSVAAICSDEALRDKWARYHIIRDSLKGEPVFVGKGVDEEGVQSLASRICSAIADEPTYSNVCDFGKEASTDITNNSQFEHDASTSEQQSESESAAADRRAKQYMGSTALNQSLHGEERERARLSNVNSAANPQTPSWLNTGLVGLSLAASVAMITVVGLNIVEEQGTVPRALVAQGTDSFSLTSTTDLVSGLSAIHVPEVDLVANTATFWVSPESSTRVADEDRLNMLLSRHIESSPTAAHESFLPYSRFVGYKEAGQ